MAYLPGTNIVAPGPISDNTYYIHGTYNNPFTPGSLEYDGYRTAHSISDAISSARQLREGYIRAGESLVDDYKETVGNFLNTRAGKEEEESPYFFPSPSGDSPASPQQLQYIDAPYAEMYGMDASTAYQEALANTAYQRKVKDLKAAGLNPVLGYSGSGAASFYGTPAASFSGGASFGSVTSGKTTNVISNSQRDTLLRNLPNIIGGVVSIVKSPSAGAATSAIGNAVSNIIRYW